MIAASICPDAVAYQATHPICVSASVTLSLLQDVRAVGDDALAELIEKDLLTACRTMIHGASPAMRRALVAMALEPLPPRLNPSPAWGETAATPNAQTPRG